MLNATYVRPRKKKKNAPAGGGEKDITWVTPGLALKATKRVYVACCYMLG